MHRPLVENGAACCTVDLFCQNAMARVKTPHSSGRLVRSITNFLMFDPATVLLTKHKDVYLLLGGKVLLFLQDVETLLEEY